MSGNVFLVTIFIFVQDAEETFIPPPPPGLWCSHCTSAWNKANFPATTSVRLRSFTQMKPLTFPMSPNPAIPAAAPGSVRPRVDRRRRILNSTRWLSWNRGSPPYFRPALTQTSTFGDTDHLSWKSHPVHANRCQNCEVASSTACFYLLNIQFLPSFI